MDIKHIFQSFIDKENHTSICLPQLHIYYLLIVKHLKGRPFGYVGNSNLSIKNQMHIFDHWLIKGTNISNFPHSFLIYSLSIIKRLIRTHISCVSNLFVFLWSNKHFWLLINNKTRHLKLFCLSSIYLLPIIKKLMVKHSFHVIHCNHF